MLVQEIKNGTLDWIPLVGMWLSEKLNLVERNFEIDFGENGEVQLTTEDSFESEDEKAEIVGEVAKRIVYGDYEGDTIEYKNYTFKFKRDIQLWT